MRAHAASSDAGPEQPARLAFQASTWYLLAIAGLQAHHRWADTLAQLNVSPSQSKVLRALGESGPLCQHQLAELINMDPRNAVPLVDSLATRGLLARQVDQADRRRRVLTLTSGGQQLAADLESIGAEVENEFFGPLTAGQRQSLREILLALLDGALPE